MNKSKHSLTIAAGAAGRICCQVIEAETGKIVRDHGWQNNLILNGGIDQFTIGVRHFGYNLFAAQAGTGTTPTRVALDGTFAQAGTTITRSSGIGIFAAGDVNKWVKFAGGAQAKIKTFTNSTTVTVDRSQTVAASALTIYQTTQTGLATYSKGTTMLSGDPGAQTTINDPLTGTQTHRRTFIFAAESEAANYTEVAVGNSVMSNTNVFTRVLLDSPVSVGIGQQLRLIYELTLSDLGPIVPTERTLEITGWPYEYEIDSIVSTPTYFDLKLTKPHHYIVGGIVNISGALPVKAEITGITSGAANFTVTAPGHGLAASNSIEIEDCSVADYNGTWTVDNAPDANTIIILSSANAGAASNGTVRLSTPGTWYDGEHTIASVPATDTVRITSAINPIDAGSSGHVKNNLKVDVMHPTYGWREVDFSGAPSLMKMKLYEGSIAQVYLVRDTATGLDPQSFPWIKTGVTPSPSANITSPTSSSGYVAGSGERINTVTFPLDAGNFDDIRYIVAYFSDSGSSSGELSLWIRFQELQRKDSGYTLTITLVRKFEPILD